MTKRLFLSLALIFSTSFLILNAQTVYTFSNAGATGRLGPTQSQVNAAYSGTNLDGQITETGFGIQEWVVPQSGIYIIEAYGAQGGQGSNRAGGRGALMSGEFFLNQGEVLKILVGQKGIDNFGSGVNDSGPGGGGTFVVRANNSILLIAGGGGGGGGSSVGRDAGTGNSGSSGIGNGSGQGGINGGGGGAAINGAGGNGFNPGGTGQSCSYGSGGGGFFSNGGNNCNNQVSRRSTFGVAFFNGGIGGEADLQFGGTEGGFGGGAGVGHRSGGGGGYSGGGGGVNNGGGAGGSINNGINQNNIAGFNVGNGSVTITKNCDNSFASATAYDNGWQDGDNDGSGFGAWNVSPDSNSGNNGTFIGGSDIGAQSWAMYANNGNLAEALRPITGVFGIDDTFSIDIDNGGIGPGGAIGFGLRNSNGENVFEFVFVGGTPNYVLNPNTASEEDTGFGFTASGLNVSITRKSLNTADVVITPSVGSPVTLIDIALISPSGGQLITELRLFNFNAGPSNDVFFNNLEYCDTAFEILPDVATLPAVTEQCNVANIDAPTANNGLITATADISFPITTQGTTTVTWTYDDGLGTTLTQTQEVTITDTEAPVLTCQDINLYLDESGNATLGANSVTDFSGTQGQGNWSYGQYFANDSANFELMPNYNVVNVFPGPDDAWNNAGNAFATPFLYDAGGHPGQDLKWAVRRWTSNMDGDIYISGDFFDVNTGGGDGANIRIFKNGTQVLEYLNIPSVSESYAITLSVNQGDVIDFAIDPKFDYTFDTTHFTADITVVSATDNCGLDDIDLSTSNFDCTNIGNSNSVSATANDVNGNSNTCSFNVTILDTIAPEVTCTESITLTTDLGSCVATITDNSLDAIVSDNCDIASITNSITGNSATLQGAVFDIPSNPTTVIWIVEDTSGNITECQTVVTVETPAPTLTSVDPTSFLPGDTVTLFGTNFTSTGNTILIGGNAVTPDVESVTELTFTVPVDVCNGDIFVTNSCGLSTNTLTYSINAPTIISITPNNLETVGGQTITLLGTGFSTTGMTVDIGGLTGTSVSVSGTTTLQFIAPGGLCDGAITVTNNCGTQSISAPYSVNSPQIFGISESPVVPGNELVIDGTNFNPNQHSVTINGINAPINSESFNSITVTVPNLNNACNASIVVTTCGNKSSTAFVSPAQESEAPIFSNCPSDINLTATSADGASASWTAPTAIDNCNVASESVTGLASGSTFPIGESTITYTATDDYGNTAVCTFIVNVAGVTPSITCPANITVSNDSGQCDAVVNFAATETNGIPVSTITYSQDPGTSFPVGTTTVTATATNVVGSTMCSFDVIVLDNENPTITCPGDITQDTDPNICGAVVTYSVTSDDNCPNQSIAQTTGLSSGSEFPVGTTTNTFVVTDASGNTATCSFDVTIEDKEVPTIACPGNITQDTDPSSCGAVVTYNVTSDDNCPSQSIAQTAGIASGSEFSVGTTTNTFVVTDTSGNTATCSFDVIVEDNENPTIACPGNITQDTDPDICGAVVTYSVTSDDNCPNQTIAQTAGIASGSEFPVGTTTNTFVVTDASGNIATCSFDVIVEDNELPTALCQDKTVILDANGQASITAQDIDNGSNDACDGTNLTLSLNQTTFDCSDVSAGGTASSNDLFISEYIEGGGNNKCIEIYNGTGAAVDLDAGNYELARYTNGNSSSSEISLTGILADGDVYVVCNSSATSAFTSQADLTTGAMTHNGNDAIALLKNGTAIDVFGRIGQDPGSQWSQGGNTTANETLVRVANITDGNTDNEFDFPALATEWVSFPQDTSSQLGSHTVNSGGGSSSGIEVTLTVTDSNGNENTCTATVTVLDNELPVITTNGNQNVNTNLGECGATVAVSASATDNCNVDDPVGVRSDNLALDDLYPVGTTTIAWNTQDANGNVANEIIQTITVTDNENPNAICQNVIVYLDANGQASITAQDIDGGSSDNCGSVSLSIPPTIFDCDDVDTSGAQPGVWINEIHYDNAGGDVGEFIEIAGSAGIDLSGYQLLAYDSDNALDSTVTLTGIIPDEGNGFGAIAFFLSDLNSQFFENGPSEGRALYEIGASVVDFISYEGVVTASNGPASGLTSIDIGVNEDGTEATGLSLQRTGDSSSSWTGPSAESPGIINGTGQGLIAPVGVPVILTVTDSNSNVSTCTASVIVVDAIAPSIECPGDITQDSDLGSCDAIVTYSVTSSDNCAGETLLQTAGLASGSTFPLGTTTNTFEVTDASGNKATCSFDVIVEDKELPTVVCQDVTVFLDANGQTSITPQDIDNGSSDNCGIASITLNDSTFDCSDVSTGTPSPSNDLFISEYIEGGGNNKCIEIYNGTGAAVDLGAGNYELARYTNGSSSSSEISLSGILADGDVYVVCNSGATSAFTSQADLLTGSLQHNGDDAIALLKNGTTIDIFGRIGQDPGSQWSEGGNTTANETLVRAANITDGNTDNEFDFPALATEWVSFPQDTSSQLGNHTVSGSSSSGVEVTLTVTDVNGNSNTCTANVTVLDAINPTIACPGDITQETDPSSCGAVVTFNVTSDDNCPNESITQTTGLASGSEFPVGTTTNTFVVTDASGNTATCSFDVIVEDNENPTIACPGTITQDTDPSICGAVVTFNVTSDDNCPNEAITQTAGLASGSEFPVGTTTNTFVVTDASGNTSTCSFDVIVEDKEAPTIACPGDITQDTDPSICGAVVTFNVTSDDNCPNESITQTTGLSSGSEFPVGTTTNTFVVTDASGNTATCSFDVIVEDNENPTIACPGDITQETDPSICGAVVTFNVTSDDNCPNQSITQTAGLASGSEFPVGTTTNTFVVTDASGNTATCSFDVIVEDNENPTIACPGDITQDTDPSICGAVVTFNVTSDDNCPNEAIIQTTGLASGSEFPVGTTTNTFVVTDASGNTATCSFDVIVEDNENPTIACPGTITQDTDPSICGAVVTFNVTSDDNCPNQAITQTAGLASGSEFPVGTTTNTFLVTDASGNTATCSFDVIVEDSEDPIIECGEALNVFLSDLESLTITPDQLTGFVSDNCEIDTITISQDTFSCEDVNGDLADLIISQYVDGPNFENYIELYNGTGVAVDLSEYTLLVFYSDSTTPTEYPLGGTVEPATDGTTTGGGTAVISHPTASLAGFLSNNTPLLTFNGDDAIALKHNGNIIDRLPVYTSGVSLNGTTLVRNPNVNAGNLSNSTGAEDWSQFDSSVIGDLGSHTIDITTNVNNVEVVVTDTSGNTATCIANVIVNDDVAPIAICQAVTLQLDALGNGILDPADVDNESYDECSNIKSLTLNRTEFSCADVGQEITVILTVEDTYGNTDTCQASVTVLDSVAPEAICVETLTIQLDDTGNASITTGDIDNGSNDACGIASRTLDITTFTCADVGSPVTVELTVIDNNGNVSSCQTIVTVEDNVDPEALCQPVTVQLDANGEASIDVNAVDNGSNDACGIASRTLDITEFTCTDVGAPVTVVLTVTDNNGNTSTCESLVTVLGDIPTVTINDPEELPEFCQGAVLVLTTTATNAASYLWSPGGETTESIEVGPEGGTFTVTVTSATNCESYDTITVAAFDSSTLLSSYTILAEEEVFLHGSNLVQSGGIGATDANGLIKLHQATNVIEFGRAANIVLNQGSTIVTPIYQPAEIPFPDFVFNDQSNNASPDVTINTNQSTTLDGSVYGTITVKQDATVTFSQSDVYIDQLKTFDGAAIEFSGCANVFINTKFMLAQNGTINANGNNVVMYVNEDVQIEKGSYVRARIHSNGNELLAKGPNGNGNNSGDLTQMIGLFIAKKVHGNKNVVWNADDLCAPCPISPTNAPIIGNNNDFGVDAFDVLTWPNPSDTEFNVQLKTLDLYSESYIEVFDISNKLVFTGSFKPQEVYAFGKQLEGGVYIVKVQQGQNSKTIRLVKY